MLRFLKSILLRWIKQNVVDKSVEPFEQPVNDVNNLDTVSPAQDDHAGTREALERLISMLPENHPDYGYALNYLGLELRAQGDYSGAKDAFERAIVVWETSVGKKRRLAAAVNNLGLVLQAMGDYARAKKAFERALRIDEPAFGPAHTEVATDLHNLGILLAEMGQLETGILNLIRALRFRMFFCQRGIPTF